MTGNTIKHTMPETGNAMQIYHAREWKYQATIHCQRLEIPSRCTMQMSKATSHFVCLLPASLWPLRNFLFAWPTFIPICQSLSPPRSRHHSSTFQGMNIKAIWLFSLISLPEYWTAPLGHSLFYYSFHVHPYWSIQFRFPREFLFSSGL